MRQLRKILLTIMVFVGTAVYADNYSCITVSTTDGDTTYKLSDISRITFDSSSMLLWNGETKVAELALASLDKLFFSETSGIGAITADETEVQLRDGVLRVSAPAGTRITLFDMGGRIQKTFTASAEETEINLRGLLTRGVYIVKVGNTGKKVMNR